MQNRGCIPYVGLTFSFSVPELHSHFDAGAVDGIPKLVGLHRQAGLTPHKIEQPVAESFTSFTNRRQHRGQL
jgi:hypothetical protein